MQLGINQATRKRVLFVEKDPALLDVYARLLDDARDLWEVHTAWHTGRALDILRAASFDVVVADINVPGMGGIEFMAEVQRSHPRASRIVLADIADQGQVARALNSVHQFLAKPFEVRALREALARIRTLDDYLKDPKLQALVGRLGSLPSLPALYVEIMSELSRDEPCIDRVSDIISRDPGMTARILQIANSAVLGLSRKTCNPYEAVYYLGFASVRSLVLSAHIFSSFEPRKLRRFSIDQLWSHALGTSTLARRIMQLESCDSTTAEEASIAGMLHDLGKLMLADSLPDEYEEILATAAITDRPVHEVELDYLGTTHSAAAAYLLGLWGLPASIVEAVAFHHSPRRTDLLTLSPLTAVHAADHIEHELSPSRNGSRIAELDTDYLAAIGVQDRVDTWRSEGAALAESPVF